LIYNKHLNITELASVQVKKCNSKGQLLSSTFKR